MHGLLQENIFASHNIAIASCAWNCFQSAQLTVGSCTTKNTDIWAWCSDRHWQHLNKLNKPNSLNQDCHKLTHRTCWLPLAVSTGPQLPVLADVTHGCELSCYRALRFNEFALFSHSSDFMNLFPAESAHPYDSVTGRCISHWLYSFCTHFSVWETIFIMSQMSSHWKITLIYG